MIGENQMYKPIDQIKTGTKIKAMLKAAGYEVRDIQGYLHCHVRNQYTDGLRGRFWPQ